MAPGTRAGTLGTLPTGSAATNPASVWQKRLAQEISRAQGGEEDLALVL